ncbi:MAG: 5'-nucleotidase [Chlorobi bacterium OLB5]|nr:MAG: 5'-nucleotidase [Chlorobi bacterium OLB5]
MKSNILILCFLLNAGIYSQSVLTLGPGTSMGVMTGADLCVNILNGTGVLYGTGTICGGLVAVEPSGETEIPQEYSLGQNYPNPFNPITNITIQIPNSGLVKLTVFDISGKEVAVLVNEELNAGTYNVDFDASHLASGIYFYRMESNGFAEVKKMSVVK